MVYVESGDNVKSQTISITFHNLPLHLSEFFFLKYYIKTKHLSYNYQVQSNEGQTSMPHFLHG